MENQQLKELLALFFKENQTTKLATTATTKKKAVDKKTFFSTKIGFHHFLASIVP